MYDTIDLFPCGIKNVSDIQLHLELMLKFCFLVRVECSHQLLVILRYMSKQPTCPSTAKS